MPNAPSLSGEGVDAERAESEQRAALGKLDQALQASPDDMRLLEARAALRIAAEDWDGALADWRKLSALAPQSLAALLPRLLDAQLDRGVNAVRQQRPDLALPLLEAAAAAMPGNPRAQHFLGSARARLGDHEGAVPAFRQALALGSRTDTVALALGLHLLAVGLPAEAERACRRLVDPSPLLAQGWRTLGAAQAQQGRLEEARDSYERAAAIEPLPAELMQAQAGARARGIPPIALVAGQKSASEYIRDVLLRALDVALCYPDLGTHPRNLLIPSSLRQMARGGLLARLHLDGSPENLSALRQAGIERVFVHLRDPRQATLSWVHHLNRIPAAQFVRFRNYYQPAVPADFRAWEFSAQLQWAIDNYLPGAVEVVRSWLAAPAIAGLTLEIGSFERFVDDPRDYLTQMLAFYGCSDATLDEAMAATERLERFNFRIGSKDEWRTVLTPTQRESLGRLIAPEWSVRLGWPPQ